MSHSPNTQGPDFPSGGEMGKLIREHNWSATPLGPVETWPQSLRSAVSILLPSKAQIVLFWGPELITIYNDAYAPVFSAKHPWALGRPARDCWSEVWHVIGPLFEGVVRTGEAFWAKDHPFFLRRQGFLEETFFDVSYDPIRIEGGSVGGIFCIVSEQTGRVIGERRLRTLRELGTRTADAKSAEEVFRKAAAALATDPADIPFSLLYLFDGPGFLAEIVGVVGIEPDDLASKHVAVTDVEALASARDGLAAEVETRVFVIQAPETAAERSLVLPISSGTQIVGALVAGVSRFLPLAGDYRDFFDLAAARISAAIANARAYEAERRRAEALAELDRAKTSFFSNVSHEFRTPLTLMLGPIEDLKAQFGQSDSAISIAQYQQIDLMHRNSLRLLKLVNTLLDFSRIEAGRVQAVYEETNLAALTAEFASVFRSAIEKAGLKFIVDCETLPEPTYVDPEMWEKIVLNLLSNAFKFTFQGEIEVKLLQTVKRAELSVRDTGTGIPEDQLPKIFERFNRVPGAQGRTHEGTGIGLALVQELARLHGGSVSVESTYGKGSTFRVFIPLGKSHLPHKQIGAPRTPSPTALDTAPFVEEALHWLPDESVLSSQLSVDRDLLPTNTTTGSGPVSTDRARILLADDNADMRGYVRRLLSSQGYEVEAVADGEAALHAARARPPGLVLTDVMMPKLDGLGLVRELRNDPQTRGVPIILVSARAGEESRVDGFGKGADDYLIKPFSARELLARVSARLELARLRGLTEQELRHARDYAEAIIHTARDPLVILEADLRVHKANEAFYQTFNVPPAETEGRLIYELGDGQWNIPRLRELLKDVVPRNSFFDDFGVTHDFATIGHRAMLLNARKLSGIDGAPARILLGIQDITKILQFQTAVRESQTRYQALVDASAQSVWTADSNGAVVEDSPSWRAFTGQTYEQWKGLGWLDTLHPEDRERISELWQRAVRERTPVQILYRVRHVSGEWRWTAMRAVPVMYPDGSVREWVGMNNDITERKEAEEKIRVSASRFRGIVQQTNAGIAQTDLTGRFVLVNKRYREIVGRSRRDLLQLRMQDITHPDDLPRNSEQFSRMVSGDGPDFIIEKRYIRPDGSYVWVNNSVSLIRDSGSKPQYVLAACIDVTDRKRAEDLLKEADRRKDEFLGMLAHELRTPLSAISNVAEILGQQRTSDRDTTRLQAMLTRQTRTLTRMVEDLLDISRITSGKIRLEKELIALSPVISRAVESTRSLMESRQHELIVSEPDAPLRIEADATRLEQILVNLLSNAAKYTNPGGRVHLIAKEENEGVCLMVRDNGIGISAEMLARVFEMFMQVDQSLERTQHGLGIGLALVRRLVEMHGGTVQAASAGVGQGSEFIVRLPLGTMPQQGRGAQETGIAPVQPAIGPARRILVVEDNQDAAESLATLIELLGHEVRSVHDGASALETAAAFRPDVVLLDIGLPDINGYEVARHLRQKPGLERIALAALTGWGQEDDRLRARTAGFDHHFVKPIDVDALRAWLASLKF